jgi:proteasome lid subunit RPN8/RPN11
LQELVLTKSQKKTLVNHANNEIPNESCAILFGKIKNNTNFVKQVFLAKNTDASPVKFTISNEELIQIYKIAESKKMEIIGIFHSHPNSDAFPSSMDKKFMNSNPVVWLIYSGTKEEFKAFLLESDVVEIPIRTL